MDLERKIKSLIVLLVSFSTPNAFGTPPGTGATDWVDLIKTNSEFETVAGTWENADGVLKTEGDGAARMMLPVRPGGDYDYRVSFTRESGNASISLFFTMGEAGQAGFEVDAWNQGLAGIQNIAGEGIPDNPTRSNHRITNGTRHTMQISVRGNALRAFFDGEQIAEWKGEASDLSVLSLWRLPHERALGVGAYQSNTTFHSIEVRKAGKEEFVALGNSAPGSPPAGTPPSSPVPAPATPATRPIDASGKRVLMVIANQDFFYREYAEPRAELEKAGIKVTLAAGRRSTCRPHRGSGYTSGDGSVTPDISIAAAKAEDYDAIMFSGGWGSSAYQYAYEGRYVNDAYNGSSSVKKAVNDLINDFVDQDKYVGALCHGVAILAWSRVDGKSLLDGKTVCCYPRTAPAGSDRENMSSWDSISNGATVLPSRSVGNPQTDADDVNVDGKILTGENDPSSRAFGQALARLLATDSKE